MASVFYIHWNETEVESRARALRRDGHDVRTRWSSEHSSLQSGALPDVLVISLDRLPAHGRAVAATWWGTKKRRHIPIVFEGGRGEKLDAIRDLFPTAIFCGTGEVVGAVRHALRHPPKPPVEIPSPVGYSGKPLAEKLGIRNGMRVCVLQAPKTYLDELRAPAGATITQRLGKAPDLVHLFVTDAATLRRRLPGVRDAIAEHGAAWVSWPKRASKVETDLTEDVVRNEALALGLVDNKVCAVNETWSGLRLAPRRTGPSGKRQRRASSGGRA